MCVCVCVCVCVGKCVQQGSHFFQMNFPNLIKSKCKQMGRVNFITETGSSRLTASKLKKKKSDSLPTLLSLEVVPLNEVDKLELFSSKEFKKINMFSFPGCICGSIA